MDAFATMVATSMATDHGQGHGLEVLAQAKKNRRVYYYGGHSHGHGPWPGPWLRGSSPGLRLTDSGRPEKLILGPQEAILGQQEPILGAQESIPGPQESILGPQESNLGVQESFLGPQEWFV